MAQAEKRENSVLFSLRELRQIEENRVQEEERAVKSAEEARRFAAEEAERRRREAEEAKLREEREAQLQIEQAREGAEREARMRVEAAEASERARQQAALEASRLQQEMEIRRAEVAKTRPTWMLAVTIIAAVAVIIAIPVAIWALGGKDDAKEKQEQAERDAREKVEAAQKEKDRLAAEVAALNTKVDDINRLSSEAVEAATKAVGELEKKAAIDKLARLDRERKEVQRQLAEAQAAAARAERARGANVSKACLDNPLAKGCM